MTSAILAALLALVFSMSVQAAWSDYENENNNSADLAEGASNKLPGENRLADYTHNSKEKSKYTELPSQSVHGKEGELNWTYIGNAESMKFHLASCEFACVMANSRRVGFKNRMQAIEAGMRPCNWCQPQCWTHVEGHIINLDSHNPAPNAAR